MRKRINTEIPQNKFAQNNKKSKRRKINKSSVMVDGAYILEELY